MNENEMLYCLIAFILGYLLSKHMANGNGFNVGGAQSTPPNTLCSSAASYGCDAWSKPPSFCRPTYGDGGVMTHRGGACPKKNVFNSTWGDWEFKEGCCDNVVGDRVCNTQCDPHASPPQMCPDQSSCPTKDDPFNAIKKGCCDKPIA